VRDSVKLRCRLKIVQTTKSAIQNRQAKLPYSKAAKL
jgi:hypothetical protein